MVTKRNVRLNGAATRIDGKRSRGDAWLLAAEGRPQANAIESLAAANAEFGATPPDFREASIAKSRRELAPYQRALLDVIAAAEGGEYDVTYGPKGKERITDFSDHPRNPSRIDKGKHRGKMSTAAGNYQITAQTWDEYAKKLNLPNFTPPNQDVAAWAIAKDRYRRATQGGDLHAALRSTDPNVVNAIGRNLATTWTSLPGGSEQQRTDREFLDDYRMNLRAREGRMPIPQARPAPFEERFANNGEDHSRDPLAKALAARAKQLGRSAPPSTASGNQPHQEGHSNPASPQPIADTPQFWDGLFRGRGSFKDILQNWQE